MVTIPNYQSNSEEIGENFNRVYVQQVEYT